MQILRADPVHPVRKRLWQGAAAVALVMAVLIVRETIVRNTDGSTQLSLGEDFLPVYAAGRLVREGRPAELYALEPLAKVEREVVAQADLEPLPIYGPFLNPPFFAAAYAPLAGLPYRTALRCWLGLNLLLISASCVLLCRMMPPGAGPRAWGLVPLLLVLPLPFWEAMCHQQNTFLSLFILCGVVTLWRSNSRSLGRHFPPLPPGEGWGEGKSEWSSEQQARRSQFPLTPTLSQWERGQNRDGARDLLCGALAGLLFYKPQLAAAVAGALVLTRGWRALLGLSITGTFLLLFTLTRMPGSLGAFLHALPGMAHWMQTALRYDWGRQVTPRSFWRLLIQGHVTGETLALPALLATATAAAFAAALLAAAWRYGRTDDADRPVALDRLIAATVASMPMMMPYYMDYDLTLLAIPAVLFAAEWVRSPASLRPADRWFLAAWIALFIELYGNPGLGSHTRFNLGVPLIGIVAGLSIARCVRRQVASVAVDRYDARPGRVAA